MSNGIRTAAVRDTLLHPFGEVCCEDEVRLLNDHYFEHYFSHAPFNREAVATSTYLIVGRRGTGKSSLAQYFNFQDSIKNAGCINVDQPEVYSHVLLKLAHTAASSREIAIPRLVRIWEFLIWSLIFQHYRELDKTIAAAAIFGRESKGPALILSICEHLLAKFCEDDHGELVAEMETFLTAPSVKKAKGTVLSFAHRDPTIVAIDSLEHYALNDDAMMKTTAALIQCASNMNRDLASQGIHVKVFIPAEVFPHLQASIISNPLKFVKEPLYLHWRPKDLTRLVCWRFYRYLQSKQPGSPLAGRSIEWEHFPTVLSSMWTPYFGKELANDAGLTEPTFPYVLRHTQLRPRQLIYLCNSIAERSTREGSFPNFSAPTILSAVRQGAAALATEVINAYSSTYPNVDRIVTALTGIPSIFRGNCLDKVAHKTAAEWPPHTYSPLRFREMVAELGVVGRARKRDDKTGILEADFEYFLDDRLALQVDDECVIHPMFFEKLNIKVAPGLRVYPFPNHPEFHDMNHAVQAC